MGSDSRLIMVKLCDSKLLGDLPDIPESLVRRVKSESGVQAIEDGRDWTKSLLKRTEDPENPASLQPSQSSSCSDQKHCEQSLQAEQHLTSLVSQELDEEVLPLHELPTGGIETSLDQQNSEQTFSEDQTVLELLESELE